MKFPLQLVLFTFSCSILQIFAWQTVYPVSSVNLGFVPQRSIFGKSLINRQQQSFLVPENVIRRPHVRQRTIRDLMNRFIANNPRIPMTAAASYSRPTAQREFSGPSLNQASRLQTSRTRYRQAMALSSSPALHSSDNPRSPPVVSNLLSLTLLQQNF